MSLAPPIDGKPKKLLDRVRDTMRLKHYSLRTERTYCAWIKRYIHYHGTRHPSEMAEEEMTDFLTYLARDGYVAASTQNQHVKASLTCQGYIKGEDVPCLRLASQTDLGFDKGRSNNLQARLRQHEEGKSPATAHRGPWKPSTMKHILSRQMR